MFNLKVGETYKMRSRKKPCKGTDSIWLQRTDSYGSDCILYDQELLVLKENAKSYRVKALNNRGMKSYSTGKEVIYPISGGRTYRLPRTHIYNHVLVDKKDKEIDLREKSIEEFQLDSIFKINGFKCKNYSLQRSDCLWKDKWNSYEECNEMIINTANIGDVFKVIKVNKFSIRVKLIKHGTESKLKLGDTYRIKLNDLPLLETEKYSGAGDVGKTSLEIEVGINLKNYKQTI